MHERPLSPHLSVYRMYRYTLLTSFANRMAGVAISVGFVLLAYWLIAIAGGARAYAQASALLATAAMKIVLALVLMATVYHLLAGIRHLVWDTGHGLERAQSQRSAWLIVGLSIVLVLLLGWWILGSRSHP